MVNGALRVSVTTGNVSTINKERRIDDAPLEGKRQGPGASSTAQSWAADGVFAQSIGALRT
jgi:hypothetical protein